MAGDQDYGKHFLKGLGNVIEFPGTLPKMPVTGKMTFIAPLADCGPDFAERLYPAICAMFHCYDMKISEINFPNGDGEQLVMFSVDITDWGGPDKNWLDQIVEESRG